MTEHEQPDWLTPVPLRPVRGDETLGYDSNPGGGTVLDFWRWAFGDLRANDTRGVLAECIVARLLGLPIQTRIPYSTFDLSTPRGRRIEVKAAAYLQAWDQRQLSTITFGISRSLPWDARTGYGTVRELHADWYVFCLQQCRDPEAWDALDLDQWRFFVLPRAIVEGFGRTVSLARLRRTTVALTATDLATRGHAMVEGELTDGIPT